MCHFFAVVGVSTVPCCLSGFVDIVVMVTLCLPCAPFLYLLRCITSLSRICSSSQVGRQQLQISTTYDSTRKAGCTWKGWLSARFVIVEHSFYTDLPVRNHFAALRSAHEMSMSGLEEFCDLCTACGVWTYYGLRGKVILCSPFVMGCVGR